MLNWKGRTIERALAITRRATSAGSARRARAVRIASYVAIAAAAIKTTQWLARPAQKQRQYRAEPAFDRRILHLGNILNNGYLNAKFLRRQGWLADSVTVDYRHVQAQPEWEEVAIVNPDLSHFDPDWAKTGLGDYKRVDWFHDVRLSEVKGLAEQTKAASPAATGPYDGRSRDLMREALRRLGLLRVGRATRRLARNLNERLSSDGVAQQLISDFGVFYPDRRDQLTFDDIVEFRHGSSAQGPLFDLYKLVQAYSLDPIYPLLHNPAQPLICFEHGTMREFPFEDSARGRLYALALKKAERVFITNADCNLSAQRLGITHYTFVPHPVDEELYRPAESPLAARLRREHDCDHIFVAPARHHWKHCPPGLENSWLKRNDILIRALGRFFATRPTVRVLVVFFEWGKEVDLSKELIAECGFTNRVRWEPIASKLVMRDYYNAADIVFDQFNAGIGTFGTVVPEALASGKPVILNYKKELHRWCFPELPPALHAATEGEIESHIVELLANKTHRRALGDEGREWFMRNHSSKLVAQRMIDVYLEIADRHGWDWRR